jgi:signal transduction protein with GAF and PtsI domain
MTALLTRQQRQAIEVRKNLRASLVEASERVRNNMDRVKSMLDVTRTLSKEVDSQAIFDRITETCLSTFHCDQVSLMILNHDSGELEVRSAKGHVNPERVIGRTVRIGQGIAGWVAKNRKPVRLGDSLQIENKLGIQGKQASLNAAMVVPIMVRDELVGVLNVSSRSNTITYDDEDLSALAVFAEQAGVTCRHTEQALWMRETISLLENELDHLKRRQAA